MVVGRRGLSRGVVELKRRDSGERVELSPADAVQRITSHLHSLT
ncbi:MAG: His/Gly/Thr/Pro-type tRNA ligase C-terminal domain-containing protein [Lysobacter sp.]